jgi:hypothetical protein
LKENSPECLFVGPCTVGDINLFGALEGAGGGMAAGFHMVTTEELLGEYKSPMDVFSYHYYNGVSERIAAGMHFVHWPDKKAISESYLDAARYCAAAAAKVRDKYMPGAQLWVTESGDAGGGGNTWASTYLDVPRTLNELGVFATVSDGIIFHNTLASSDYGWLRHGTFEPRPNYFAVLLWNTLMGTTVYDSGEPIREGAHVYCHSRRDGKEGKAYVVINNSMTETTTVELPGEATVYALTGTNGMRSRTMCLNGKELVLGENDELPDLSGITVTGQVKVAPGGCTFIVV